MKATQKPCIFLENAVCLLVPNETDNGACLTVTRFPQGHIAQKFRDLTKRSPFCIRSSFEPQAHDSLGISALSGSWESRLEGAGRGHRDPERLRGLEVEHQREFRGLLYGQVPRCGTVQDLVHVRGGAVPALDQVC